ncbi:putative glucuronosyltransferase PGSIP6 [Morella rubra]|uniref:Putative glucuronosyltransferase PGSIP6 n=1 Tax=Morella rubra TaxID=262757 RepID=A0A6A1URM7_9ROSI|nr:putative glucuronosyltransferase PGSIP6 [Morella rubra]
MRVNSSYSLYTWPLKPWDWWTSWLLKPVDVWQDVREQLEESLPGTGGGRNRKDDLLVKLLFLLPFFAFLSVTMIALSFSSTRESFGSLCRTSLCDRIRHLYYRLRSGGSLTYTGVSTSSSIGSSHQFSNGTHSQVPIFLGGISVVVCFMAAVVSLAFALAIVPRQVLPWTGLLLMYEWIITLFILFFGGYLHLIYLWGKTTATQAGSLSSNPEAFDYDSGKVTAAASTFVAGTSTVTPGPEEAGGGEAGGTGVGGIGKGKGDPEEKAALLN